MRRNPGLLAVAAVSLVGLVLIAILAGGGPSSTSDTTTTTAARQTTTTSSDTTPPPETTVPRPDPVGLDPNVTAATADWLTDWSMTTIDLGELQLGIPVRDPRDRIPPIDNPVFEDVDGGGAWLEDQEPGVLIDLDGDARFYPLRILTRHEIVNDEVGDRAVTVTYCPLCNSAVVFDPVVGEETLRFGVSGLLRHSDLVMWDDATQSLWQQITGQAIVGSLAGEQLRFVPSSIVSWGDFKEAFPDGRVLSQDTGFGIAYGANPYVGYSSRSRPFDGFFTGEIDERYPALERVVGVSIGDEAKAYPFSVIADELAVNDEVGGEPIVVLWGSPDTTDALDHSDITRGAAIGTGVAYLRTVDDQVLTFTAADDGVFTDAETGSTWTLLGEAIDGPLAGSQLETAIHRNEFWFAWQVFFAGAPVYEGAGS